MDLKKIFWAAVGFFVVGVVIGALIIPGGWKAYCEDPAPLVEFTTKIGGTWAVIGALFSGIRQTDWWRES